VKKADKVFFTADNSPLYSYQKVACAQKQRFMSKFLIISGPLEPGACTAAQLPDYQVFQAALLPSQGIPKATHSSSAGRDHRSAVQCSALQAVTTALQCGDHGSLATVMAGNQNMSRRRRLAPQEKRLHNVSISATYDVLYVSASGYVHYTANNVH
jgi:hypothetical protein